MGTAAYPQDVGELRFYYPCMGLLEHTFPNIHTAKQRQNMTQKVTNTQ